MDRRLLAATLWMLVLSVVIGWIPVVGPLAAGFFGGRKAGTPGAAAVAALLPALVAGALVWFLAYAMPGIGALLSTVFAAALFLWIVVQTGLVFVGALLGGWSVGEGNRRGRPAV